MTRSELIKQIKKKKSYLCIGLDSDIQKIPAHLRKEKDPVFEFNKQIIDATHTYCIAYKPNIAFYESLGAKGWESLEKTLNYIPENIFTIADGKRCDIGNTATLYARGFFETLNFDAATVVPYMGEDSVMPFLDFPNKWTILVTVSSNSGSNDFQFISENGEMLYQKVVRKALKWGTADNLMFVAGATNPDKLADIRKLAPTHFILVPGYGAQGGDLKTVSTTGLTDDAMLIVSASRNIIFASANKDFAQKAGMKAMQIQQEMEDRKSVV